MNEEDRSRFEDFRQFRKEVRGSTEYLLVGIDVAKDQHHAFFGTATGKTLFRRLVVENSLASISTVLEMTNGTADLGEADDQLLVAEPRHGCWGVGKF